MNEEMSFGNLDNVETNKYAPFPAGEYTLRALDIEMKETKNGKGINVEFVVVGGDQDNKKIFEFYNVMHTNQQTVEIALAHIKAWILACGQEAKGELKLSQILSLEGQAFRAKVGIEKDKTGQYDDKNKIKRYLEPQVNIGSTAQASPASQPAAEVKPWEK